MITSIIAVLVTFGLVIFLHELGHFLVCRASGIKVEAFSFGFGPELWGRTSGPTRYSIRAIPLGGYVKPAGENIEEVTGHPDEYFSKPWYTRLAVVFAGPTMNYVLAFVLFAGVILVMGEPVPSNEPVIAELNAGYPAERAGMLPGDRVVSVDGKPVATWQEMAAIIRSSPERGVALVYEREGAREELSITPQRDPSGKIGLIGIAPGIGYKKVPVLKALEMGLGQCWYWTAFTVKTLAQNIYRREKPDLAGPIGIVGIVSKAAHTGMADFVFLVGLISVAVGFFNLLPIPLLDGGHAVLYLWEGISGRKLTVKLLRAVNSVGIAMLLSILLFATYSDIMRLRGPKKSEQPVQQEEVRP